MRHGRSKVAFTGNLCAARFEHDASRALDAQLHTHLVTANATFDARADKWFALTEREMLAAIRYAGKVYQNELARGVLAAGYEPSPRATSAASSKALRSSASRRRTVPWHPSVVRKSNRKSPRSKSSTAACPRQRRFTASRRGRAVASLPKSPRPRSAAGNARTLRRSAARRWTRWSMRPGAAAPLRQRHFTRESRCDRRATTSSSGRACSAGHEVIAEALNQSLGSVSLDVLKKSLTEGRATDCVALKTGANCLHTDYATRAGLQQELDAIEFVNSGRNTCVPLGISRFEPDERLSADQRNAVETLLESTDRVCALRGVAGAGKTFTLQEVQRGLPAAGRTVLACAPTTSAVAVLRAEGFANATTLAELLQNAGAAPGARLGYTTLIVDEAGIASTRQGAELCTLVQRQGARLILVGDSRQHSGVEAGDFLSILERHSRLRTCELTDIRRQTVREYRGAVKLMAQGQAHAGLRMLDQLGWVQEPSGDYIQRAAAHYVDNFVAKRDTILCGTHVGGDSPADRRGARRFEKTRNARAGRGRNRRGAAGVDQGPGREVRQLPAGLPADLAPSAARCRPAGWQHR